MALQIYEDRTDPSTGQDIALSTDPRLAEFWGTFPPVRDYAHLALEKARKEAESDKFPGTLRHAVGLEKGWQEALEAPHQPADTGDDE